MYPRNAASPERIAIGQVVLIADGTVQSASVTITVRGQGGAEAPGGGTTAFGADNTVYYTPTQAETNFTSFVVIASKASCFSASQTIITSASSTAGNVILAGVTHTSAVIPTVTTLTGHTAQTGDSFALIGTDGQGLTDLGGSSNNWNTTTPPTVAAIADGVWDEPVAGHVGAGTFGKTDADILADTNEIQGLATGATGFAAIDTVVDAILVDTGTTIPAQNVDILVDTAAILIDTADMQPRVAAIEADTNELQSDWADGGRLDLIQDVIAADTTTDIPALIATAQADLDTISDGIITGTAGSTDLATTTCSSNLTGYTNDQLIGRVITFLAGPADGESSGITDYVATNGVITFDALTLAPENGNAFKIT